MLKTLKMWLATRRHQRATRKRHTEQLMAQLKVIDTMRQALELIALNESLNPVVDAHNALIDAGLWDAVPLPSWWVSVTTPPPAVAVAELRSTLLKVADDLGLPSPMEPTLEDLEADLRDAYTGQSALNVERFTFREWLQDQVDSNQSPLHDACARMLATMTEQAK